MKKTKVLLVPMAGGPHAAYDLLIAEPDQTLAAFLERVPSLSLAPLTLEQLALPVSQMMVSIVTAAADKALYLPPGLRVAPAVSAACGSDGAAVSHGMGASPGTETAAAGTAASVPSPPGLNGSLTEELAVKLAYHREIEEVASFLRAGLSVLVKCDKLVVNHLWKDIVHRSARRSLLLEVPDEDEGQLVPRGLRQRQLARLKTMIRDLKDGDVLVIPHLDLLAGGVEHGLPTEARELIELVYQEPSRLVLAFTDRTLTVPEVLASRFAVRYEISGVPPTLPLPGAARGDKEHPLGSVLVTGDEAAHFEGFEPESFFKNVAGMNPVRLRHAVIYAVKEHAGGDRVPVSKLYDAIRTFKAKTSSSFEVPDVNFDQIGGYDHVKDEILRALRIIERSSAIPHETLRRELIPRGFLFHGPPGTGKTLFAKAVANRLTATIQIVSGPEVTDMYVGESERKVRELFAEARRNAPAVIVFDEFDAIASKRSGSGDGGARAGNAIVAQILTEMDGFRPDVTMLVIGTTNRLDIIDDALLRPSRFKDIHIGLPNPEECRAIAAVHADRFHLPLSPVLLDVIGSGTEKMNGDQIRSIFRDAYVGWHVDGQQPSAYELGRLVGKIRLAQQQLEATRRGGTMPQAPRAQGQPFQPPDGMIPLDPSRPVPSADDSPAPREEQ